MVKECRLPELGENIEKGTVTKVLIREGDVIAADQPILELETDKAILEVPAPAGGKVISIHVQEGQKVAVGELVAVVSDETKVEPSAAATPQKPIEETRPTSLIEEKTPRIQEQPSEKEAAPQPLRPAASAPTPAPPVIPPKVSRKGTGPVPAAPSVRRLAREIGVDINEVPGTGPGGRITEEDVKSYARQLNVDAAPIVAVSAAPSTKPVTVALPDFARWGEIEQVEMSGVRKRTAEAMSYAWTNVPHVTQFDKADITEIEKLRKSYGKQVEQAGGKLTLTAVLIKLLPAALKKFPRFNSSVDMANETLILKKYYHIGVAVDTDRGLLVPVIRDCDKKSLMQISVELSQVAERARSRKTTLEEMQGGTFTVTNLGGIGGSAFTPIVRFPEVAILGVSRASMEMVYRDGEFVPRLMVPLSLSYDHRVIDGADGARFLRWICEALEQPFLALLEN
ncbi:MAG TPA: 2-oxo acid dehydrogenase subunit E2 [Candidatus Hydrogenedentes bacterium]|nr:2-oxo acid dehydrogenase subunit E2 [Candidatus Hydrogenedentota bacterium]HOL76978.1 2-oxo acid dehydrogenase subunit E2 [Candidatus Hydrogenedentota bacterium]HPO86632.1 2-oxo acid dehydrogenase subunit E2 [Candidatus Hydrogenedentota bacterium]